jgi:hypothetical protein
MKTISLTILSIFLCSVARAELKWEQTTIELHPNVGDKQAIAHFKYENVGKTPVHFKSVHASCGCTTAQSQKDEVPPGEKGEITATFNIGERTGMQIKTVAVQTDEATTPNTVLTLRAALPDMLTINPTFVYWKAGEEPKPKTITVKAGKSYPAKNLKVNASNGDFTANVEPGSAPSEWKISVSPKQTERAASGVVTIVPEVANLPTRVFYANASVTGAPPSTPAASPAH